MGLVDLEARGFWRGLVLPLILCGWVPEDGIVCGRHTQVLSDAADPGWETVNARSVRSYHCDLKQIKVARIEGRGYKHVYSKDGSQIRISRLGAGCRDGCPTLLPYLDFGVVLDGSGSIRFVGQKNLVHPKLVLLHGVTRVIPSICHRKWKKGTVRVLFSQLTRRFSRE